MINYYEAYKVSRDLKSGFHELISISDKPELDIKKNQVVGYIVFDENISADVFKHVLYIYPEWIFHNKIKIHANEELFGDCLATGFWDVIETIRQKQYGMICCKPGIIK